MAYCFNPVCPQPQNPSAARFCKTCGTALILENRYRLISLLGQGGFGRTFLGEPVGERPNHLGHVKKCVIKQINKSILTDASGFQAEADRLRKLGEHPQIPRLFEAFENDWGQFLVQEFAPGKNLHQQVASRGPWNEDDVRSLLTSLVAVLQYVHGFQIIHRDIKPENIVSHTNGSPMLVDFGSAKWVRQAPAKTVIGSAGYASPEQSMGQATFASDIYSLGLTCLNLLTGVHPFDLYSAAEDRWVWKDFLPAPVGPNLAQVLDKMVARALQQRYASMEQVEQDLKTSQNSLMGTPQQLLAKAKESLPGLKSFLKPGAEGKANSTILASEKKTGMLPAGKRRRLSQHLSESKTQPWRRIHRLAPGIGLTQAIALSPNGQLMVSGSSDGAIHLWRFPQAQLIHTFPRRRLIGNGHRGGITALAFHPDGRALYSASEDGTIKEWDVAERQLLNTLPTSGWTPTDLRVTKDGTQLVSAHSDGKIVVWAIESLLPVTQLLQHQRCVNAIAFSQNIVNREGLIVSASDDGTIKLWKPISPGNQTEFRLAKSFTLLSSKSNLRKGLGRASESKLRAITLAIRPTSQDTQQLVVATEHTVLLYHLNVYLEVSEQTTLCKSESLITAIALSTEAQLAVGTEDRRLTLWDLMGERQIAELTHDWGVSAITFAPDGRSLITASADEVISIWQRDA